MLQPAVIRKISKELMQLQSDPPEDIRVQVDEEDILQFIGIIAGPEGTPYHGGYFRIRFTFGNEFPAAPPKCVFTTKIFHPNVSAAGDICVNTLKKDWKPTYGITHILTVIKCLLIYPNPESALDEEAGKMLLDDYDGYCKRAKLITSIHATRGGRPVEFEDASSKKAKVEDPLAISFLDSATSSEPPFSTFSSGSRVSQSSTAGPSTTSTRRDTRRGTSARPRSLSQSPNASIVPLPGAATGLTLPPLRTSANSNGAPLRASPAPNDKDAEVSNDSNTPSASATTTAAKKESTGPKPKDGGAKAGGVSKAVKRPASAVSGGVKENGNGAEKRKKGLRRL